MHTFTKQRFLHFLVWFVVLPPAATHSLAVCLLCQGIKPQTKVIQPVLISTTINTTFLDALLMCQRNLKAPASKLILYGLSPSQLGRIWSNSLTLANTTKRQQRSCQMILNIEQTNPQTQTPSCKP